MVGDKKRFLDRILRFMGIEEEVAASDEFLESDPPTPEPTTHHKSAQVVHEPRRPERSAVPRSGSPTARPRVITLEPIRFNDVQAIADHLMHRESVMVDLEHLDKVTARRVLDFLGGTIYALGGHMQRVRDKTFLLAPGDEDLDPERDLGAVGDDEQITDGFEQRWSG